MLRIERKMLRTVRVEVGLGGREVLLETQLGFFSCYANITTMKVHFFSF